MCFYVHFEAKKKSIFQQLTFDSLLFFWRDTTAVMVLTLDGNSEQVAPYE